MTDDPFKHERQTFAPPKTAGQYATERRAKQHEQYRQFQAAEMAINEILILAGELNNTYVRPLLDPRQMAVARTHFEEGFRALYIGLGAKLQLPDAE